MTTYNILTNEFEPEVMTTSDWDTVTTILPANGSLKKVTFKNLSQLKKSNTERLHDLFAKIFGFYNPYADRWTIITLINNWMQDTMIKALDALSGVVSNVFEACHNMLSVMGQTAMKAIVENDGEGRKIEKTEREPNELDLFFVDTVETISVTYSQPVKKTTRRAALSVELIKTAKRMLKRGAHYTEVASALGISVKTSERINRGTRYAEIEI